MHAGAGLYIRLKHRFGPRLTEWLVAVQTALWGGVLLLPSETYQGLAWAAFREVISENALGSIMLFLGVLRLAGLIVNGARKNVTPWIRVFSASVGFLIFVGISAGFAFAGIISTWIAIYPALAFVELINIYRAAHDAGENNGGGT